MGEEARTRWLLAGLGLLFLAAALAAPINHDESQYVAAIALMREGLPYRDWPYLQTPLQPLLLSPLSLLPAGWLLVAARLANVLFALVTCWALLRLLKGRVPFWAAALAVGGMATTNAFLFGTEVARNDMLPASLLALGLLALLPAGGLPGWRRAGLAGLCLGLAVSAKISMALPAAGVGLWLLWRWRVLGVPSLAAAAAGGLAGLAPSFVLFAIAPQQFVFGVFTYSLVAPQAFWTAIGEGDRLQTLTKLAGLGLELLKGPAIVALVLTLTSMRRQTKTRGLLELALVGGLIGAGLPDPFFRQYLVPALPPLFALAGLGLAEIGRTSRRLAVVAGIVAALVGAGGTFAAIARAISGPAPLAEAVERGRLVAAAAAGGQVVSLASEQVAGRDIRLHPGFVTGPFLFRMHGDIGDQANRVTGAPTFQRMQALDQLPPAVILTGGERRIRPPLYPRGLDWSLDQWAARNGYRPVVLPGKEWLMWVAPTQKGGPAGPPSRSR